MCGGEEGADMQISSGTKDDYGDVPRGHKAVWTVGSIFKGWAGRYANGVSESAESMIWMLLNLRQGNKENALTKE